MFAVDLIAAASEDIRVRFHLGTTISAALYQTATVCVYDLILLLFTIFSALGQ